MHLPRAGSVSEVTARVARVGCRNGFQRAAEYPTEMAPGRKNLVVQLDEGSFENSMTPRASHVTRSPRIPVASAPATTAPLARARAPLAGKSRRDRRIGDEIG